MASTIERPPADELPSEGHRDRHRIVYVVTAILAVATLVFGGMLMFRDDSGVGASVPSEVQQVLDQFLEAEQNADYETFEAVVTQGFRRPMYQGDLFGGPAYRNVMGTEYFASVLDEDPEFDIKRIGDPIVRGNGPWYVSFAETWEYPAQNVQYEAIVTYALVERNGMILVDDAYWAGHSVLMEP
jgi:hypothetical protein